MKWCNLISISLRIPAKMLMHYLIISLLLQLCTSTDTISPSQPLTDGDLLVSKGGNFSLGFFTPQNTSHRYVGVWYNRISEQTVVWVLNRDHPINDTSGVLSIDTQGNLVLYQGNTPLWYTNISVSSQNSTEAQLLNTGNLILIQNDEKRIVWQGFDYPTDNMIPYMKLGQDRSTGLTWSLSSWKSLNDPGTGEYSYKIDVNGSPQMFLYKGSQRLWRTGHWNGLRWSGVPEMANRAILHSSFVNDQDELASMFTMVNASVLSRITVDGDGTLQRYTWHESAGRWQSSFTAPRDRCDAYGRCGPYSNCDMYNGANFECTCLAGFEPRFPNDWFLKDGSDGCVRKRGAKVCGNGEGFLKVAAVKPPDTAVARVSMSLSLSLERCREECLKDCSCMAYSSANVSGKGSGCLSWHGDLVDTRVFPESGQDIFVRVDATTLAENEKKSGGFLEKKGLVAILTAGVAFLLISISVWLARKKKTGKGKQQIVSPNTSKDAVTWLQESPRTEENDASRTNSELQVFDLGTIIAATHNLSDANKLGRGGFGSVYKGLLLNGQEIAVKRLSKNSGQGIQEFKNEVTLIAKLQHRNLVKLLGCCIQGEEKMLIYEYLPNKSLDSFIFDEAKRLMLDWRKRFEIVVGIARGILYLHQDSRLRIIHRDLKASNVLLDAEMTPKISDFGMAKIFGGNQIEGNTNRVVGTYGYMSPEYAMEGLFSIKSDVYSFGVLLLEIISGRKNTAYCHDSPSFNLVGHVWNLWGEGKALDIIDPSVERSYPADEVLRCIQIGLLCVQEFATDRPTMSTVIFMLGNNSTLPFPKPPAFVPKPSRNGTDPSPSTTGGACSVNEVTMTMVEAR